MNDCTHRLVDIYAFQVALLLLMVGALLLLVGCNSPGLPISERASPAVAIATDAGQTLPSQAQITLPSADAELERYDGVPVGFTEEGYPFQGDPSAPLTLVEYSDYQCPFCALHRERTLPALVEQYVTSGQMVLVFRDFPLAGIHPQAPQAHAAALCVGEQGAARYWQMHDELIRTQAPWGSQADPSSLLGG